jgi:acyl carrier protein
MSESILQNQNGPGAEEVNALIARVLTVPLDTVRPDLDLVYDLGAESIDFLDLLFSLDPLVGTRVLPEQWTAWIRARLPESNAGEGITPGIIHEFALHCRAHADAPTAVDAS